MSDQQNQPDRHERVYAAFCGPHFQRLNDSMREGFERIDRDLHGDNGIEVRLRGVEIKTSNGFDARIKFIEKMQWWQLGVLVALVTSIMAALWYMHVTDKDEHQRVIDRIEQIGREGRGDDDGTVSPGGRGDRNDEDQVPTGGDVHVGVWADGASP